ncbi:MAG: DUF1570 domain-containing protein [Planctomycetaceae bacterium]|nr:DUF1570 domain-containing protein [Planctomycetaceae bacterium]
MAQNNSRLLSARELARKAPSRGEVGLQRPLSAARYFSSNSLTIHFWVWVLLASMTQVSPIVAQDESAISKDNQQVKGSRLLQPSSFGFKIPVAQVRPNDLDNVKTRDEDNRTVVAKSYVKVGDNYVVLLPTGRLVDRFAKQVEATSEKFEPIEPKALAKKVIEEKLSRFSNVKTHLSKRKHYVFLYNTSEKFLAGTEAILVSMFNGVRAYAENMGIETHDPDVPLVVIMFQTQAEFQAYQAMPQGVVAYYDMVSNHIVLCEESPLFNTRPDLAQGQLISTIAHEGAHQILHNIGVQKRLSMWPMWLSEGIAEFFAPTSFGRRNRWKGAGDINNLRMFELESFLQTRFIEGVDGKTIRETVTAPRLDSTGYAAAWSIVHFLSRKKRRKFYEYVAQMSQLKPMRGMVAPSGEPVIANLEHFNAFFGEDSQENEESMIDYLGGLNYESPVAGFVHYVGLVIVPEGNEMKRYACCFHTQQKVDEWKAVLLEKLTSSQIQQAKWELKKVKNRGAANGIIRRFIR